jgi:hypothetical protein
LGGRRKGLSSRGGKKLCRFKILKLRKIYKNLKVSKHAEYHGEFRFHEKVAKMFTKKEKLTKK